MSNVGADGTQTPHDAEVAAVTAPVRFSKPQQALLSALARRDAILARMFEGALFSLSNGANPDRYAQSAHSLRELMEKLPEHLDVPITANKESLKPKVSELQVQFAKLKSDTSLSLDSPNHQQSARTFLTRLDSFFDWFERHNPRRRAEIGGVLQRMDGLRRELPLPLADLNVTQWMHIRDYFVSVCHHRQETSDSDFLRWLNALTAFLLDRLVPRTFDDFDRLDALIEGGHHAHP